jgi:hypothetical protein
MSRTLSPAARRSANAAETDEVWLVLLTFTHASLEEPLRFVNNYASVESRGDLFIAFPFEIELPGEDAEGLTDARIRIDNIDRQIVRAVREMAEPPDVTIEIVLASQPDTVEAAFDGLVMRDVGYDAVMVTGVLRFEQIMQEPVTLQMTPSRLPGLF